MDAVQDGGGGRGAGAGAEAGGGGEVARQASMS